MIKISRWRDKETAFYPINETDWVVLNTISYEYNDKLITVPRGFISDLTSTSPFESIIPRWGKHGHAAVIHDYLYATKETSKFESELIFYDMLRESGVGVFKSLLISGVTLLFGKKAWNEDKHDRFLTNEELDQIMSGLDEYDLQSFNQLLSD